MAETKACVHCSKTMKREARRCLYCGKTVPQPNSSEKNLTSDETDLEITVIEERELGFVPEGWSRRLAEKSKPEPGHVCPNCGKGIKADPCLCWSCHHVFWSPRWVTNTLLALVPFYIVLFGLFALVSPEDKHQRDRRPHLSSNSSPRPRQYRAPVPESAPESEYQKDAQRLLDGLLQKFTEVELRAIFHELLQAEDAVHAVEFQVKRIHEQMRRKYNFTRQEWEDFRTAAIFLGWVQQDDALQRRR